MKMKDLKWNVHVWDGRTWSYLGTVKASDPETACDVMSYRNGLGKRYQAWPHIDNLEFDLKVA